MGEATISSLLWTMASEEYQVRFRFSQNCFEETRRVNGKYTSSESKWLDLDLDLDLDLVK